MRTFDTFSQTLTEAIEARIWAGLHYRSGDVAGQTLGRTVATYGAANSRRALLPAQQTGRRPRPGALDAIFRPGSSGVEPAPGPLQAALGYVGGQPRRVALTTTSWSVTARPS